MWCPILGGGPPITIIHVFDYPYEEEDVYVKNVLGDFGSMKRVKKQTYLGKPDVFTGTRLVSVTLDATLPRFITINGYLCRIWYKGQPLICNLCGVQGHKSASCPNKDKCRRCGEEGHFARSCPNLWGNAAPPTANSVTDDSEYPALPSQQQDSDSQDALEIEMQAPLATALAPPTAREVEVVDGENDSVALFSSNEERVSGEGGFVDSEGYLVEQADYAHEAGPHIVKEIIIYDVYENDDNGPGGITNPVPPNEGEGSNTNEIAKDSDNYVEITEYTNEIANDSDNYVEVTEYTNEIANDSNNYLEDCNVTEHVGTVEEGAEHDLNNEVEATKNGKETSSSKINEQSNVGPAKNGTPSIEIIKEVVDKIVDNNSEIENNVAVEGVENMETAVSEVPPYTPKSSC